MHEMSAPEVRRPGMMPLLAATVFASASTVHFQTPMLGRFASELAATPAEVGWIPTLTFAGFLAGIVLLVPLGDRIDKRKLIFAHLAGLIAAVLGMAVAPALPFLWLASFAIGVFASLSQYIVPLAVELAPQKARGAAVGTIMSGLFLGILFGRVGGGIVATTLGWRWMYVISALMLAIVFARLVSHLPASPPGTSHRYRDLMGSLLSLYRREPLLRRASTVQFLLALGYGGFWATIAAMLVVRFGYGPTAAGLVGIPGAAGLLIARPAGIALDRYGAAPVTTAGIATFALAFVVLAFGATTIAAVLIGAALLDCGLRAAMVANQTLVTSVDPKARSRLNTLFQAHMWGGNAVGAVLLTVDFTHAGWWAVCGIAFGAAALAIAVQLLARRARVLPRRQTRRDLS
jgi:predicted MFS family arabinose efflux permease